MFDLFSYRKACHSLLCFLLCSISCVVVAQHLSERQLQRRLQKVLLKARRQYHINALSLSLLLPGKKKPLTWYSGWVDHANKTPISSRHLFQVGSITKTFTAALLAQAIRNKKVALTQTLGLLLPQHPKWKAVTVAQLVNQTSGLADSDQSPGWFKRIEENRNKVWSPHELVSIAYQSSLNFTPGSDWAYS